MGRNGRYRFLKVLVLGIGGALAVQLFIWLVEFVRALIHWVADLLADITPMVLFAVVVCSLIVWFVNRKHQI